MGKVCNGCGGKTKRSDEWSLSGEMAKYNKRLTVLLLVVVFCWMVTVASAICGVLWLVEEGYITEATSDKDVDGSEKELCASSTMSGWTLSRTADSRTRSLKL